MRGLEDSVAVITGGASGIGRASAKRLAAEGATVVVTDIDEKGGEETVAAIETDGGSADFHSLDVRDYEQFGTLLEATVDRYGGLNVVFNNAGIGEDASFSDTTPEHRDEMIDVNMKGVWNGCHAAYPLLAADGGGSIINTSSMAGWMPAPISTYAMTKAAVLHFTRSIAHELGRDGVRVNAICPGTIDTAMTQQWYSKEELSAMASRSALSRLGEPDEIASVVAFLASDDASYITGRGFKIDGGFV
ncbi:SDR family NAD(P)-dependent oxidoreductase [Haladaptatus pallidirubidus]|uniref:SDR family oxidoreductase n=1 Tax=Haladaptatus pallidirubidus TaxID=1008152 RepID=A0AAV3UQL9_9EURY|nr:SDR family oxidoreductase [Haladaptatus pallidirubidus]